MLQSYYTDNLLEVGLDEVGRGCLAGPVVAAAVILPKQFDLPFLNDSKKLTHAKRVVLADEIKKQAIEFHISEIDNQEIDQINILNASILAMHHCLNKLKNTPELILVDGNKFKPYNFIQHICVVKGDSKFASIAAASIIAKVYRDELMTQLHGQFPYYGWNKNAGYPTKTHRKGIEINGTTHLHRMSFKLL